MAIFPAAVATNSDLYVAVNATSTQLSDNPLTSGATTVNVVSATAFPSVGFISIDNEIIQYTGTTGTSFTGCTRGADGTSAVSHVQNSQVFHNVIAAHHNVLKDEIIAIETQSNAKLGTSSAAYTASRAIQSGTGGVLEVSAVTTTELGYVSGVTSALQTQLNAKAADSLVVHLAGTETITGSKSFSSPVLAPVGSLSAPGLSFNGSGLQDNGVYLTGSSPTESIGFACRGVSILTSNSAGLFPQLLVQGVDGTVGGPAFSFANDPDTGFYSPASGQIDVAANAVKSFRHDTSGTSNGTTYRPVVLYGGASATGTGNQTTFDRQTTSGVSTTATAIYGLTDDHCMVIVTGATSGGAQTFTDLIMIATSTTTVVSSSNNGGAVARTYSQSGGNLRVAMASGTYGICVQAFSMGRQNG